MIIDGLEIPKWASQFLELSEEERHEIWERRLTQLKKHNPESYKATQSPDFVFVGITPGETYMKVKQGDESDEDFKKPFWHKYSNAMLLYWYKPGRCFMIFGPELRFNDSLVNEIEGNERQNMEGMSG